MGKIGKRYNEISSSTDSQTLYSIDDAVKLVKNNAKAKFNETIEISFNLGLDPKQADQMVRGVVNLPEGTGKVVKVAVFARDAKAKEAEAAGADIVGSDGLIEKIKNGDTNFDKLISTTGMMLKLSKLGKVLGPKGLMPNPKLGTVSDDISEAVKNAKSGQVEIRNDKDGNIGVSIGKKSFSDDKLIKNYEAILESLDKEKSNNNVKGNLIKSSFISSSMGVSFKIKLEKSI